MIAEEDGENEFENRIEYNLEQVIFPKSRVEVDLHANSLSEIDSIIEGIVDELKDALISFPVGTTEADTVKPWKRKRGKQTIGTKCSNKRIRKDENHSRKLFAFNGHERSLQNDDNEYESKDKLQNEEIQHYYKHPVLKVAEELKRIINSDFFPFVVPIVGGAILLI